MIKLKEILNEAVPLRIRGVKQNIIDASDALWQIYKDLKNVDMKSDKWSASNNGSKKAKKMQDELHKLHQDLRKAGIL
jgi:hypothetical protein